jgi:hypothetical protein
LLALLCLANLQGLSERIETQLKEREAQPRKRLGEGE